LHLHPATPTTQKYTLSLHDALPIFEGGPGGVQDRLEILHDPLGLLHDVAGDEPILHGVDCDLTGEEDDPAGGHLDRSAVGSDDRSEEHTSELQSRGHLVCRLLLEKK